jgi:hypothetical protein
MAEGPLARKIHSWNSKYDRRPKLVASSTSRQTKAASVVASAPPPVELSVPQAHDPHEARRLAMDLITSFSADHEEAEVRIVRYD